MRLAIVAALLVTTSAHAIINPQPVRKGAITAEVRLADLDDELRLCAQRDALTRLEFRNRTIAAKPMPAYEAGWHVTWGPKALTVQPIDPVAPEGVEFKRVAHRTDLDVYLTSGEVVSVVLDTCPRRVRVVRVTIIDAATPIAASAGQPAAAAAPAAPRREWRYSFVPPAAGRDAAIAALAPDAVSDDGQAMCVQYAAGRAVPAFYTHVAGQWVQATPTVRDGCYLLPVQMRVLLSNGSARDGGLVGGIEREHPIERPAVPEPVTTPARRIAR